MLEGLGAGIARQTAQPIAEIASARFPESRHGLLLGGRMRRVSLLAGASGVLYQPLYKIWVRNTGIFRLLW